MAQVIFRIHLRPLPFGVNFLFPLWRYIFALLRRAIPMKFDRHFRYLDILRRPRIALAMTLLGASVLIGCTPTSPTSQGLGSWLDKMDQASEKAKTKSLLQEARTGNAKSMYYLG